MSARTCSTEKFLVKATAIHGNTYDYTLAEYKSSIHKLTIICKIHGEFYQTPSAHISSSAGCPKCGRERAKNAHYRTHEEFLDQVKAVHGDKYDYSKTRYIMRKQPILITCKIHGDFEQTAGNHLNGRGCRKCGIISSSLARTLTLDQFVTESTKYHKKKYDYSLVEYKSTSDKVRIICPDHGEFEQTPADHMVGKGCKKCGDISTENALRKPQDVFIDEAKAIHTSLYDYSKVLYVNTNTKVIIICSIHGEFEQTPSKHINAQQGCFHCCKSRSENACRNILEEIFPGCLFPSIFPKWLEKKQLDGYNEDLKLAFEYQGVQHYEFVPHFQKYQENFQTQIERDRKKAEICDANGVALLIIPYTYTFREPEKMTKYIESELRRLEYIVDICNIA